jgi:hypothetical protein
MSEVMPGWVFEGHMHPQPFLAWRLGRSFHLRRGEASTPQWRGKSMLPCGSRAGSKDQSPQGGGEDDR